MTCYNVLPQKYGVKVTKNKNKVNARHELESRTFLAQAV